MDGIARHILIWLRPIIRSRGNVSQSTGTSKPISLAIGEELHLKCGKDCIIYVGMSSKDIHSVVQKKVSGNRGYAWKMIYSTRRHDIAIDGGQAQYL